MGEIASIQEARSFVDVDLGSPGLTVKSMLMTVHQSRVHLVPFARTV